MKNSWKYDAEVRPQQKVTVLLLSQLYFHEVSSAWKQATFILKCTVEINKDGPAL